jgi:hypothetical protein
MRMDFVRQYCFNKISIRKNVSVLSHVDFNAMFEYIANNGDLLQGDNFIIKLLPYYYITHIKLGSYSHLATTHIQQVTHKGIYSVYFSVIGREWFNGDTSQYRVVHDQLIVS